MTSSITTRLSDIEEQIVGEVISHAGFRVVEVESAPAFTITDALHQGGMSRQAQ